MMGRVVAVASLSTVENSEIECSENSGGLWLALNIIEQLKLDDFLDIHDSRHCEVARSFERALRFRAMVSQNRSS